MDEPRHWDWQPWLLGAGLLASLLVVVFFAVRGWQLRPRRQVDEPIHPWMTVPYIARSYSVPPAVLYAALGLPARPPDRRPILAIARAQNRPVSVLIAELQAAIRQERQSPATPPAATATLGAS